MSSEDQGHMAIGHLKGLVPMIIVSEYEQILFTNKKSYDQY